MTIQQETEPRTAIGITRRTRAAPIGDLPGALPNVQLSDDLNSAELASSVLTRLPFLSAADFTEGAVWRASLALTGTFRTFNTRASVFQAWTETSEEHGPVDFQMVPGTARIFRVGSSSSWIDARFTFRTTTGVPRVTCSGFLSIVPDVHGHWKIWMLRTILQQIEGAGDVDQLAPALSNGAPEDLRNGPMTNGASQYFDCIVVGGGQAGLGVGGRLQALGLSYLIVDKHAIVGDSWDTRYDSTKRELNPFLQVGAKTNPTSSYRSGIWSDSISEASCPLLTSKQVIYHSTGPTTQAIQNF